MELSVESEVDKYGDEVPRAFFLGAQRIAVVEVLDRWFGRDHRYFKVRAEDRNIYILRNDLPADRWELTFFKAEGGSLSDEGSSEGH